MIGQMIMTFIFMVILVSYNIPSIPRNSLIQFKIYLFVGIFLFEFVSGIMTKMYHKEIIDTERIVKKSIQSGLLGVIAYAIYNDTQIEDRKTISLPDDSINGENLVLSLFITIGMAIGYGTDHLLMVLSPDLNDRLDKVYAR
jgi:hypothetical protein